MFAEAKADNGSCWSLVSWVKDSESSMKAMLRSSPERSRVYYCDDNIMFYNCLTQYVLIRAY